MLFRNAIRMLFWTLLVKQIDKTTAQLRIFFLRGGIQREIEQNYKPRQSWETNH
jgi:hypothetical protein